MMQSKKNICDLHENWVNKKGYEKVLSENQMQSRLVGNLIDKLKPLLKNSSTSKKVKPGTDYSKIFYLFIPLITGVVGYLIGKKFLLDKKEVPQISYRKRRRPLTKKLPT